jgi:dCMP deaminase
MNERPALAEVFFGIAQTWALRSTCSSRVAVGCVLVNQYKQVIASGYNGSPRGLEHCDEVGCDLDKDGHCVRALHAEENAIIQCAMTGVATMGSTLYVTHSPCPRCARVIIQAGIVCVVFMVGYKGAYATEELLKKAGIPLILWKGGEL